ncbi:MAG: MlaE family ABC transporter permease [Planctomycetota bacterium]|jgi:phospholipid/cholesterol/gamma-HCH transport system permease protein
MSFLADTGAYARQSLTAAGYTFGLGMRTFAAALYLPRRFRFTLDHAFAAGVRALPVTTVVALFSGMILALQTGIELRNFGQSEMIGTITSISMCREMGPFITSIILAAMVGSSMAAEIGTMKVSEEVTALDVMSIDPTNYLVLPRVLALTIMCPLLTVFSNLIGISGGAIVGQTHLDVSQLFYWTSVRDALFAQENILPKDVYVGLFKSLIFGFTIAIVSCAAGLRADGGALGVGRAVQHAVMTSIVLIIIFGYIITWFFYFLIDS